MALRFLITQPLYVRAAKGRAPNLTKRPVCCLLAPVLTVTRSRVHPSTTLPKHTKKSTNQENQGYCRYVGNSSMLHPETKTKMNTREHSSPKRSNMNRTKMQSLPNRLMFFSRLRRSSSALTRVMEGSSHEATMLAATPPVHSRKNRKQVRGFGTIPYSTLSRKKKNNLLVCCSFTSLCRSKP